MIGEELAQLLELPAPDRAPWCSFDPDWYLVAYPAAKATLGSKPRADAVREFYVEQGRELGHSPNMYFDEGWYLFRYRDAAAAVRSGQFGSGYEHYCAIGYLSRSPHWLYDETLYLAQSPDLTDERLLDAECVNLYDHYLRSGAREGRLAHRLFHPEIYMAGLSGRAQVEAVGAFEHYLRNAWFQHDDADTTPYFDRSWFLHRYPEVASEIDSGRWCSALNAYLAQPDRRLDPNEMFSESYYLEQNEDVRDALAARDVSSGYEHFLRQDVFELRAPKPEIDLGVFVARKPRLADELAHGVYRDAFLALLLASPAEQDLATPPPVEAVVVVPAVPDRSASRSAPNIATGEGFGHIEFYGHQRAAHGWFFCGWISPAPSTTDATINVTIRFELGQINTTGMLATLFRPDVAEIGVGAVVFVEDPGVPLGRLLTIHVARAMPAEAWTLTPIDGVQTYRDSVLAATIAPPLNNLFPCGAKAKLIALAARRGFTGNNTLGELHERVFLEIDEAIICPRDGLALIGWALWEPGSIARIRLQSGHVTTDIDFGSAVRLQRPDVRDSVGAQHGFNDVNCGFIVFLPHALLPDETCYIEVETTRGEFAHRGLPTPKLRGMDAIRFLLNRAELRYAEVVRAYDRVFGPAITMLNNDRLRVPPGQNEICFGQSPATPVLSVIVALYGRLDFMEYQFGFASRHKPAFPVEYIYVLDDPSKKRECEDLAASIWQRFQIPLRLIELQRNMGFAPANNVGLEAAKGELICFLNSDVFAGTDDWMERLVARLRQNPRLGAVGPLLLYEDDCVQHLGMTFERLPIFGDWYFPMHPQKGWRAPDSQELQRCVAITGACMVIRRSLALEFGGFDESYIVGDFEDSDLCLKLRERELHCAVDLSVRLYHLERQSQAGTQNLWRMNLTVYNAWVHERRWNNTLRMIEADGAGS